LYILTKFNQKAVALLKTTFLTIFNSEIFRRKREAREPHLRSKIAKKLRGHKAKLYHKKRYSEKVQMRKLIKQHEEKQQRSTVEEPSEGAIPAYLLDRQKQVAGNILSNAIKQKRKEKAVSICDC
jgi:ribosome biogenesis protein NSA2